MKKLFFTLLIILILSQNAEAAPTCRRLFQNTQSLNLEISGLNIPLDIKRRLKAQKGKDQTDFLLKFILLIDELHMRSLSDILNEKNYSNLNDLGFRNSNEARTLKERIILQQFRVLSLRKAYDYKLQNEFIKILKFVYSHESSKSELLSIYRRLNELIIDYSST